MMLRLGEHTTLLRSRLFGPIQRLLLFAPSTAMVKNQVIKSSLSLSLSPSLSLSLSLSFYLSLSLSLSLSPLSRHIQLHTIIFNKKLKTSKEKKGKGKDIKMLPPEHNNKLYVCLY